MASKPLLVVKTTDDSITVAHPDSPNLSVRRMNRRSDKTISGHQIGNVRSELILGNKVPTLIGSNTILENISCRFSMSGSPQNKSAKIHLLNLLREELDLIILEEYNFFNGFQIQGTITYDDTIVIV